MYSLTVFKAPRWWEQQHRYVYDNKTHRRMDFSSWAQFANFLRKLSQRQLEGKQDAELISPAIFKPGQPRRNANVLAWAGWAAIDVDDWTPTDQLENELHRVFGDYKFVCYSTASSTVDHPKFRVVFPLSDHVAVDNIRHFWFALQSEFNQMGDKQCKDFSRMYYVPANYKSAYNFFFDNRDGQLVDVDYLLAKHPYVEHSKATTFLDRLPEAWRKQIIDHRKNKLDNTNYNWNTYHDCPFVNKQLIDQYKSIAHIDGTGRYRMIYKIMISIASNAVSKQYPLTVAELVELIRQLDQETSNIYQNRPLDVEANNALEFAYKHSAVYGSK